MENTIAYKTVHTGPKSQLGGAQLGLINCEYQLHVFIRIYVYYRLVVFFSKHH